MLRAGRLDASSPQQLQQDSAPASNLHSPSPAVLAPASHEPGKRATTADPGHRTSDQRTKTDYMPVHSSLGAAPADAQQTAAPSQPTKQIPAAGRLVSPSSPVSDELLTPGQFTQPSPVQPQPSPNASMHSVHAHASQFPPSHQQTGAVPEQQQEKWWEGAHPQAPSHGTYQDGVSGSEDAPSQHPSLSLEDVPIRRQTIRTHGSGSRQRSSPKRHHGHDSLIAAPHPHSFLDQRPGSPKHSRSPHKRGLVQDPAAPLQPISTHRTPLKRPRDNAAASPLRCDTPHTHQDTPVSISHTSDTPHGPTAEILGLLETGAPPPVSFYGNEHIYSIEPPSLDELDPEEQVTPHDIPSPLKATSRRTLFRQQGLVGKSSGRSTISGGLGDSQSGNNDIDSDKRAAQQEQLRLQLEAFVLSSRRNSQQYISRGSIDPLETANAMQGSSTRSQDGVEADVSEGQQSPEPRSNPPPRHHTSPTPHSAALPNGASPHGGATRRSSSRPPSRSHSERRRRVERSEKQQQQPHARHEGGSAGVARTESRVERRDKRDQAMPPQVGQVAAHVTSNVQHPLQSATSAPQPISPVSAPSDLVEPVQELPAQVMPLNIPKFAMLSAVCMPKGGQAETGWSADVWRDGLAASPLYERRRALPGITCNFSFAKVCCRLTPFHWLEERKVLNRPEILPAHPVPFMHNVQWEAKAEQDYGILPFREKCPCCTSVQPELPYFTPGESAVARIRACLLKV